MNYSETQTPLPPPPHCRSMFLTLGHLFLLEMVNVYCMMPLVWQSVLNTPLFAVFHFFIAVAGELL